MSLNLLSVRSKLPCQLSLIDDGSFVAVQKIAGLDCRGRHVKQLWQGGPHRVRFEVAAILVFSTSDPSVPPCRTLIDYQIVAVRSEGDPLPVPPRPVLAFGIARLGVPPFQAMDVGPSLPGLDDVLCAQHHPKRW